MMTNSKEKQHVIYIAGGGHSGSTILSLILGTAPEVFTAGEVKFYNQHKDVAHPKWEYIENVCMCGKHSNACPYWHDVGAKFGEELYIFHYMGFREKIGTVLRIFSPFYRVPLTEDAEDDYKLFREINREALKVKPTAKYVLDSSKSVARLMHLNSHPLLDVKVIFLVRDGRGFINSYAKVHKKGFFRWMAQWVINNILTLAYLKKEKIDYYYLSYNSLCEEPGIHLAAIGDKFDINIPDNYAQVMLDSEFHIRAGNPSRAALASFTGLKLDEKWRHEMPVAKRLLATAILYFFNRRWVY